MASPPAWSIGTSQRGTLLLNNAPGPGHYSSGFAHKSKQPSWRMGSASRSTDFKNANPGPGTYNPPVKITKDGPKYPFGMKTARETVGFTPGPGAYNASGALRSGDQRAPSYSMRVKTGSPDGRINAPGPGAYDHSSRILSQSIPNMKIGTSKRDGLYGNNNAPGPGTYSTRPATAFGTQSGPKYGFGSSKRDHDPLHEMSKTMPGPGAYQHKSQLVQGGTSMVPRRPDSASLGAHKMPGPGAYNPMAPMRASSPAYRIGTASRDGLYGTNAAPGPGQYDPRLGKTAPAFKMGTGQRPPLNQAQNTPGPGNYNIVSRSVEGPKYFMSPRLESKSAAQLPGPGQYSPRVDFTKDYLGATKIGTSSRDGLYNTGFAPGPGQYDIRKNLGGPKWGFGSGNRDGFQSNQVPGPGTYNPPSRFADVPKYAFQGSPMKIHL